MGEGPVSWIEINAWCERTGIELDPWEARTIRALSTAYVAQAHKSRKPDCPSPLDEERKVAADQSERVDAQFAAMFASLKAMKNAQRQAGISRRPQSIN